MKPIHRQKYRDKKIYQHFYRLVLQKIYKFEFKRSVASILRFLDDFFYGARAKLAYNVIKRIKQ